MENNRVSCSIQSCFYRETIYLYNNHTHTHTHARAREPFNLYLLEHVRANVVYLATEPSIHLRRASDSESSNLPVTSPLIISSNTESSA
jgi:hypothetical protein